MNPLRGQTRIPRVFASDESYAMPLATALRSIIEVKRTVDPLEVYILYNSFQEGHRTRVMKSMPPGSVSIHWVPVDLRRFESCVTTYSRMTYARLLIPELLPRNITK